MDGPIKKKRKLERERGDNLRKQMRKLYTEGREIQIERVRETQKGKQRQRHTHRKREIDSKRNDILYLYLINIE